MAQNSILIQKLRDAAERSDTGQDRGAGLLIRRSRAHHDVLHRRPQIVCASEGHHRFDDERTVAALEALNGMANRFQGVVFTHHTHLADLAERSRPTGHAHLHALLLFEPPLRSVAALGGGTSVMTVGPAPPSAVATASSQVSTPAVTAAARSSTASVAARWFCARSAERTPETQGI